MAPQKRACGGKGHGSALLLGVSDYLRLGGACVMSCQIIWLWQLQLVGSVGDNGWMEGWRDGWLVWLTCCLPEVSPVQWKWWKQNTLRGRAPWPLVDMLAGSGRVVLFSFWPKWRVLMCPTGNRQACTAALLVLCPALYRPKGPPPVGEGSCSAWFNHSFQDYRFVFFYWTFKDKLFVMKDFASLVLSLMKHDFFSLSQSLCNITAILCFTSPPLCCISTFKKEKLKKMV